MKYMKPQNVLTVKQVARYTGCSKNTIYEQINNGKWGPVYRTPKIVILEHEFLIRFNAMRDKTIRPRRF